ALLYGRDERGWRLCAGMELKLLARMDHRTAEVVERDEVGDADVVIDRDVVEGVARLDDDGRRGGGRLGFRRLTRHGKNLAGADGVPGQAVHALDRRYVGSRRSEEHTPELQSR